MDLDRVRSFVRTRLGELSGDELEGFLELYGFSRVGRGEMMLLDASGASVLSFRHGDGYLVLPEDRAMKMLVLAQIP